MKISELKDVIKIIRNQPLSILIISSLILLPAIIIGWIYFFPDSIIIKIIIVFIISGAWIYALYRRTEELKIYHRKIILYNYLKKEKRHTIKHLSEEWAAKEEFTIKNINELLIEYPKTFKRLKVKNGEEYLDGVGLVTEDQDV